MNFTGGRWAGRRRGWGYLGLAVRGEVLLDEQGPQGHAEVLVGLSEAQPAELQALLGAVDLPRELVDGAAEGGGEVLAQRRHHAPQHVVVQDPREEESRGRDGSVRGSDVSLSQCSRHLE